MTTNDTTRYELAARFDDGTMVEIDKVGGGTIGKSYAGENWTFQFTDSSGRVAEAGTFYHGMPATHQDVAIAVHEHITTDDEDY